MQVYEITHPNLNNSVIRFKVLTSSETQELLTKVPISNDGFRKAVLEAVVLNLRDDVTPALRKVAKTQGKEIVDALFNAAIMINPGLDLDTWFKLSSPYSTELEPVKKAKTKSKKITKTQFLGLERYLRDRVIGQDEAISQVVKALKRPQVGLNDERRPLGVFLFAGASGVGKTHLAKELQSYLFGTDDIVRIDCGEYQHKHENSKLLGAPPGYMGYDEGGHFTNAVKKNPHTVILLDEVEKAHPDVWHTFLRVFDEGIMTDASGKEISFRDAVIIMTTNLGNREVVDDTNAKSVGFSKKDSFDPDLVALPKRERVERHSLAAIRKKFSPEFLNRIDKTVIFNHLTKEDYEKISELELAEVNDKLGKRGFSLVFDVDVVNAMVADGMSSIQGARRISQIRRDSIEDLLADQLLTSRFPRGTVFQLTRADNNYVLTTQKPSRVRSIE